MGESESLLRKTRKSFQEIRHSVQEIRNVSSENHIQKSENQCREMRKPVQEIRKSVQGIQKSENDNSKNKQINRKKQKHKMENLIQPGQLSQPGQLFLFLRRSKYQPGQPGYLRLQPTWQLGQLAQLAANIKVGSQGGAVRRRQPRTEQTSSTACAKAWTSHSLKRPFLVANTSDLQAAAPAPLLRWTTARDTAKSFSQMK